MKTFISGVSFVLFILVTGHSHAQVTQVVGISRVEPPVVPYASQTDPALNHNRLLQSRSEEGVYKLIGTYKVIGSSFLYGPHIKGDVFSATEKASNIFINYNTYNQEVEFYSSSNPDNPLVKEPGTLDSFIMQTNIEVGINKPLKFIYGPLLGTSEKAYYQEVATGSHFSLYKRYKSELDYATGNYVQSELRQFNLEYDFFYAEAGSKSLKKLKTNTSTIIKEFKAITDLSAVVTNDALNVNKEETLIKAFGILNKTKE
jgi:hypothetical protein